MTMISTMANKRIRDLVRYDYFVILPDDRFKEWWDLIITIALIFTSIVTPYRVAFVERDSLAFLIIDGFIDGIFTIDIFVNFVSAYYNSSYELVDKKTKIA